MEVKIIIEPEWLRIVIMSLAGFGTVHFFEMLWFAYQVLRGDFDER